MADTTRTHCTLDSRQYDIALTKLGRLKILMAGLRCADAGLVRVWGRPEWSRLLVLMYYWTKACLLLPSQLLSNANIQRPIFMPWSDDCPTE